MGISNEETRYPEKGDKFFIETGHQDEMAWLHKSFQKFGSYADSYQAAALSLIDTALANKELRDYHVYPAIFLVRHYLELRLKELIQGINFCREYNQKFPAHHDIKLMWGEFKKAYQAIGENANDDRFKVIDELIKEMDALDPESMAFRYPVNKQGEKTQKLTYINLKNFREIFVRVSMVLDAVAWQIAEYVGLIEDQLFDVYGEKW
jgi:hypothetical protein